MYAGQESLTRMTDSGLLQSSSMDTKPIISSEYKHLIPGSVLLEHSARHLKDNVKSPGAHSTNNLVMSSLPNVSTAHLESSIEKRLMDIFWQPKDEHCDSSDKMDFDFKFQRPWLDFVDLPKAIMKWSVIGGETQSFENFEHYWKQHILNHGTEYWLLTYWFHTVWNWVESEIDILINSMEILSRPNNFTFSIFEENHSPLLMEINIPGPMQGFLKNAHRSYSGVEPG